MASHPATPTDDRNTSTHNTISVNSAKPKPSNTVRCGRTASSATFATPSNPKKNQTANGIAAHTPIQPCGKAFRSMFAHEKCGKVTPEKINSSTTASTVTTSSNPAAALTP